MSVFRFEATPTSSKPFSKRMKGKTRDSRGPTFAFSTSPSLLQDITLDKTDTGLRTTASSGLTMKEYEEQLKKLTAENFNLKLRVYFVEERLSKVTGISDKEDLIKKNIQLQVTCESQLKELEKKQELLFEASKAFELLQKEHAEEVEKLMKEKEKGIVELEEKLGRLEAAHNELKSRFPNEENMANSETDSKNVDEYEKQINELELSLRDEEDRYKELENILKDAQLDLESYQLKSQRLENELDQRIRRIEELVDELERKERDLAAANFRIRKVEDELESKQREDEILKERIEEKNKTIESLKTSLASRDESIEVLENRLAKERSSWQTLQNKMDSVAFQNARLKEELEILQSRLRRSIDTMSPRGKTRTAEDEAYKQKYEEIIRLMNDQEAQHSKRLKELEEKLYEKDADAEDYQELFEKHKKLEDDHRKACTALKNFIKRSSEEKKEREGLNLMLNNHEEVIADLKAQLDKYQNPSTTRVGHDEKLSLAGTGDNDRKFGCTDADNKLCCDEKDKKIHNILSNLVKKEDLSNKESKCSCGVLEKMQKVSELEAEVVVLKEQLEQKEAASPSGMGIFKQFLVNELETKKCEIEKLNEELKKRNINLQEVVNKELWDKNRQIEKLEKRLAEVNKFKPAEWMVLNEKITAKDQELKKMRAKLLEMGVHELGDGGGCTGDAEGNSKQCLQECVKAKEQAERAEWVRKEAAEACSLLSARLEELAAFLDSLLTNKELLTGIEVVKRQDIRQAVEKSRELSRHLSLSFAKENPNETSLLWSTVDVTRGDATQNESLSVLVARDKVISEQTIIINRLREQLKILTHEIKQRDIELSHCQGDLIHPFAVDDKMSGIEGQSLSICQDVSEYESNEEEKEVEAEGRAEGEKKKEEPSCRKTLFVEEKKLESRETSESETWSEPDRSVSLARMGRLEDGALNLFPRNSKCDDSSEISEETLNENPRNSGKRCRSTESEIRRLQSRIKILDEANENLRLEIDTLKNRKWDNTSASRLQKNEEANLVEKLRKTMERVDECSLTCRQLEEKLAGALERASTSAMQLSKATETISELEEQINKLKKEITAKTVETEEKGKQIQELESKIEEMTIESELKVIEAVKQKEVAERKTQEVEHRLKDAENLSKEVESRVFEIEKKISETKKFKKETVLHFKEAEKHVDTAEKMMEEAEQMKMDAEKKSKDFQSFIDLMRKEVEEKLKEAEKKVKEADRRIKKSDKEKEELEKQVAKLKKRLMEAERNKVEVEMKVKEGKETIQCMEEKLKELELAMDQCSEEAKRKIKEMQKKADARVAELEMEIEERDWVRKTEVEKRMMEAEKISRELEVGLKKQLEDADRKVKKAKENADLAIKKAQEEWKKQEVEFTQRIFKLEAEKKEECADLRRQIDEVRLEASEFELELTKLTNEKIHLEEELKRMLDKESALVKDHKEIRGKYEFSIHELENKLSQLTLSKSHIATRLEGIETTNIDLLSRISAIRGEKGTMTVEHEYSSAVSPSHSPPLHDSFISTAFRDIELCFPPQVNENKNFTRQGSALSDPGDLIATIHPVDGFSHPRRNINSSPDLGIESDPGRFSSLEANHQTNVDQAVVFGGEESSVVRKLEVENAELKRRLVRTRQALEETLSQLSAANHRKKQVERAICKQLHKTHHILKKARVNMEAPDGDSLE